jgi:hypothetical protein
MLEIPASLLMGIRNEVIKSNSFSGIGPGQRWWSIF